MTMNETFNITTNGIKLDQETIDRNVAESIISLVKDEKSLQLITNLKIKRLSVLKMLSPIVEQICDCLYFQHNYAALTLTNYLFEAMIKLSLILHTGKEKALSGDNSFEEIYSEYIEEYKSGDLHPNIEKIYKLGMITTLQRDRLLDLKDLFRNPFSHFSGNSYINNTSTDIYCGDLKDPQLNIVKKTIKVDSIPKFMVDARLNFMQKYSLSYFCEIHNYLILLDEQLQKDFEV